MITTNYHLDSADCTAEQEAQLRILIERENAASWCYSCAYDEYDQNKSETVAAFHAAVDALTIAEDEIAAYMREIGNPDL